MTISAFAFVITGVLLNAIAQLALKASVSEMGAISVSMSTAWPVAMRLMSGPWLWVGLSCYVISVVVWILALSRVDVSIAYPMLSIGYIVNALAAWALLGEALGPGKILGIGVITVGVIILARS
jgi:multidrug transporter EmrE-like cation transporter